MSIEILRSIFNKQLNKEFPFNSGSIKEYTPSNPLPTNDVYSLYKFRYENHWTTIYKDPEYEILLDNLKGFQGPNVIIHMLDTSEGIHLFFTDETISTIIGVLYSPKWRKIIRN